MRKEKRLVVLEKNFGGGYVVLVHGQVENREAALAEFLSWASRDIEQKAYFLDVIVEDVEDGVEFYVPTNFEWKLPLNY